MRLIVVIAGVAFASTASAQTAPTWSDVPALIAAAAAPHDDALRACFVDPLPQSIALIATRARDGHTEVAMPFPNVGYRGFTPEEVCLMAAVAKIELPPLPAELERIVAVHTVTAAGAAPPAIDPAFAAWLDPAATLATSIDATRRAALAACDRRPRTIRLVVDLRKHKTRVWLPAWQFHSKRGDGTTPPAQRTIKTCVARAIRTWQLPLLPRTLPELHVAFVVAP
jgi:hypothetical protein